MPTPDVEQAAVAEQAEQQQRRRRSSVMTMPNTARRGDVLERSMVESRIAAIGGMRERAQRRCDRGDHGDDHAERRTTR